MNAGHVVGITIVTAVVTTLATFALLARRDIPLVIPPMPKQTTP